MRVYTSCRVCATKILISTSAYWYMPMCVQHQDDKHATEEERLRAALVTAVLNSDSAADTLAATLDALPWTPPEAARAYAKAYAAHGWPVFPLRPTGDIQARKQPATRNGLHDATTDLSVIDQWWSWHPKSGVGLPTGVKFDVLDIDFDKPGAAQAWLKIKETDLEVHAVVGTPRGLHVYIKPTGKGNGAKLAGSNGIDYRGKGGYVCAPPTTRPDGRYEWLSKPSPEIL